MLAAAIALAAYIRARPRDYVPGGHALRFLFLTVFIWSFSQGLSMFMKKPDAILLAAQFSYIGIALTPVAWIVFAITYSQRVRKISRHLFNTISVIPAITLLLALSNPWHELIWSHWAMVEIDGFTGFVTEHGFWFYVHAVYSYSLILVGTAILAFALNQYRQHYQTLLAAVFAPILAVMANLFSISSKNPYPWLDLTPLGFVLAVVILDIGILRRGLLQRAPVARDRVVEQLKDPVLVLSHDGTIIDANQSALAAWETQFTLMTDNIARLIPSVPVQTLINPRANSEATIDGHSTCGASDSGIRSYAGCFGPTEYIQAGWI